MNRMTGHDGRGAMAMERPGGEFRQQPPDGEPTKSTLAPWTAKSGELLKREYFWPIAIAVVAAVVLFKFFGQSGGIEYIYRGKPILVPYFSVVTGALMAGGGAYLLARITGKGINWIPASAVAALIVFDLFFFGPLFTLCSNLFRGGLGPFLPQTPGFLGEFIRQFVNAGVTEETYKALPLLALLALGASQFRPWNERFGLREPLDGIILGVFAGAAFSFVESSFFYFSKLLVELGSTIPRNAPAEMLEMHIIGLRAKAGELLIPRLLHNLAGHSAWAGLFGYFIGLAALYPARRWKLLAMGLGIASAAHALWNTADKLGPWAGVLPALIGVFLLGTAIIKARALSPNRGTLKASMVLDRFAPALAGPATPAAEPSPGPMRTSAASATPPAPTSSTFAPAAGTLTLRIGATRFPATVGLQLEVHQIPGLAGRDGGPVVASIEANPRDPAQIGLLNLSTSTWRVTTTKGDVREIAPGLAIRLASGTRIDFGTATAEVV